MKLNRRYTRNIRENLSFYIASTVLTVVTLFLYFMFAIAGNAILNFGTDFFASQKVEDANFTTYTPIPDEEITKLEEKYDLTLEAQKYVNIETDDTTARVFHKTDDIDLYKVTVGSDAKNSGEIIISEGYAVNNDVQINDTMKIGDKNYTVTGFSQRPDYLYMLQNPSDSYKNITTFYLAYMTDEDFENLGNTNCQYLVRYNKDNQSDFRKYVHENYYMHEYTPASENMRITMVSDQAEMFILMAYVILCVLPLIAVALVSIIISRKVKSEQKMIGTLSALGYKKGQLMRHYAGFAAIPGLLGGIVTTILSAIFAQPYSELGLQDYEPMRIIGRLNPIDAVLGIIVPTAMYVLAALISVRKMLKKDTVLLLAGNADGDKHKFRKVLADKKIPFRFKYAVRSVLGNPARTFVVLLGVFLGCFIMLFSFSMFDSMIATQEKSIESIGDYKYQYILNSMSKDNPYGGEELLVSSMEKKDGSRITVMGTDKDNPYLNFNDEDGEKVNISDGYYITSLMSMIYDWQAGDKITLYNPLSLEEKEIKIKGIVKNDMQKAIITSIDKAADISGLEKGTHNALISDAKLDIPSENVAQETRKTDLGDQIDTIMNQMGFMIYLLVGLGIIICIAAIYVSVNMMVTENKNNISMLKVLGYRNRQIDKIVLNVNHIFLPIGILLSIPAAYGVANCFFKLFADIDGILVTTSISLKSYLLSFALTIAGYVISVWLVRRKVKKVDMIECLKDNRE